MKDFNIFGVHWKIRLLGGDLGKPIYRGRLPKKGGGLGQFVGFREGWQETWGGVFDRGCWYPNAHYDYFVPFGVIENRFTKIKFKYFNGNRDYSSSPVWWILFLYALPHKGLAFWKNYLLTSLSFHIVLKSLLSY